MRCIVFSLLCAASIAHADPKPAPPPTTAKATPAVTAIAPAKGDSDGGTYARIAGRGFLNDGQVSAKVYFGKQEGTVVRIASDTEMIVEAPSGKAGEVVDVRVVVAGKGELVLPHAFTYVKKT